VAGWGCYFCFGFVAAFLADFCGGSLAAFGLVGLLAFVSDEAAASFAGDFVLAAALAGSATDAISADVGLPAGFEAVFLGASDWAGGAGEMAGEGAVTTGGDGGLGGAAGAAFAGSDGS
jgi:hypothetical protein